MWWIALTAFGLFAVIACVSACILSGRSKARGSTHAGLPQANQDRKAPPRFDAEEAPIPERNERKDREG